MAFYPLPENNKPVNTTLPWKPGIDVGVNGGIKQYITGRTGIIDVTVSIPGSTKIAAGTLSGQTYATVTSGSTLITVASTGGWRPHEVFAIGAMVEYEVTGGATADGAIGLFINKTNFPIPVLSGDSPQVIAGKIASGTNYWGVGRGPYDGTGGRWIAQVLCDSRAIGGTGSDYFGINTSGNTLGYINYNVPFQGAYGEISSITGNVFNTVSPLSYIGNISTLSGLLIYHDDGYAIADAISNATSGQVVYLGINKEYRTDAGVGLYIFNKNNITVRGGSGTRMELHGQTSALYIGGNSTIDVSQSKKILSGMNKGSTEIFLNPSDVSSYSINDYVAILIKNDPNIPVVNTRGYDYTNRLQMAEITGKTSNSILFYPQLLDNYTGVEGLLSNVLTLKAKKVGIESIIFDSEKSEQPTQASLSNAIECWIYDSKFSLGRNFCLSVGNSLKSSFQKLYLDRILSLGTNHFGIGFGASTQCLFEDSIVYRINPLVETNAGTIGCAFLYNFFYSWGAGADVITNHAAHNSLNLYEGNIIRTYIISDGYHGSNSQETIYRNWLGGVNEEVTAPGGEGGAVLRLNRFSRNYAVIGNIFQSAGYTYSDTGYIFGLPNFNNSFSGYSINNDWPDFQRGLTGYSLIITTGLARSTSGNVFLPKDQFIPGINPVVISINSGITPIAIENYIDAQQVTVSTAYNFTGIGYIWPGSAGFQELDSGVELSTLRVANYNHYDNAVPTVELNALSGLDLLPSLAYTGKPDWWTEQEVQFGVSTYPPFDPFNLNESYSAIPAGNRFVFTSAPSLQSATINAAGTLLTLSFNKNVYFGVDGSIGFSLSETLSTTNLTYIGGEGTNTLQYSLSRFIYDNSIEAPQISYSQPGDGIKDINGNLMESFSNILIVNYSTQSGGLVDYVGATTGDATTNVTSPLYSALVTKVRVLQPGNLNRIRVFIHDIGQFGTSVKTAIYNYTTGTYIKLVESNSQVPSVSGAWLSFSATPIHLSTGEYWVAVRGGAGEPTFKSQTGQPNGTSWDMFNEPFFVPIVTPPEGYNARNDAFVFGIRMILDEQTQLPINVNRRPKKLINAIKIIGRR